MKTNKPQQELNKLSTSACMVVQKSDWRFEEF